MVGAALAGAYAVLMATSPPRTRAHAQPRPGEAAIGVGAFLFVIGTIAVLVAFVGYLMFGITWTHAGVVVPALGLLMAVGLAVALVGLWRQARSRSLP